MDLTPTFSVAPWAPLKPYYGDEPCTAPLYIHNYRVAATVDDATGPRHPTGTTLLPERTSRALWDMKFSHLTPTSLRDMVASIAEEYLIDSLQDGEFEVSDFMVR